MARPFSAPYTSRERTKAWFGSIQQQFGSHTAATFGYGRHTDEFIPFPDRPAVYENITTSYEAALRRADDLDRNTTLSYDLEEDWLGRRVRNQGAGYANLSLRSLRRFSLVLGGREEIFSGGDTVFSPLSRAPSP